MGVAMSRGDERWAPVAGYDGRYEVSDRGRVRVLDFTVTRRDGSTQRFKGHLLPVQYHRHSYPQVVFAYMGKSRLAFVHRLMAVAFLPNPDNLPLVRHLNDDPRDNRLGNLAWGTQTDNMRDCVRNGHHREAQRTHCDEGHEYRQGKSKRYCPTCRTRRVECPTCGKHLSRFYLPEHQAVRHGQVTEK